ncbi:STAS-like domain-containing protein [Salinibacter ruber]|jgi:hypothetical protein|uniref:STAS-like domain-containing protein n=1 Tax=Salinibacter ruber TaxID=146919 RepID=UPI0020733A0B|nr:STAS-like domain-containing protein [Salinibacter ruber]
MVIKVGDHVKRCYSNEDGREIREQIKPLLLGGREVTVSFEGFDSVTSSFVNSAFIELLSSLDFGEIKERLDFADSNRQINRTIKRRFSFEVNERIDA